MSYSRRRVSLACTFCRHRKRRCDAEKPVCGNCREADAECHYDNLPVQRFEPAGSNLEILDRLQGIQNLLESHAQSISTLSAEVQARPMAPELAQSPHSHHSMGNEIVSSPVATSSGRVDGPVSPWFYNNSSYYSDEASLPPLTIPAKHNTSSNYLLCLPEMKTLIGEYPTNLFFKLESRNVLPAELTFDGWLNPLSPTLIDRDITDYLVSLFFSVVHPCHPILDPDVFSSVYTSFIEKGVDNSIESALCLVVLALGAATISPDSSEVAATNPPGLQYMQTALPALMSLSEWAFEWQIFLPQALVLASVYFAYLARPLQSWRLVYSASTIIQFKMSSLKNHEATVDLSTRESILRLFWSSFLIECDRLAELELPQSNLQLLIDETPLPSCTNLSPEISTSYLAEISIRRLLNRIHNTLYPRRPSPPGLSPNSVESPTDFSSREISSVGSICDELHRQLDMWLSSIPEHWRPVLSLIPMESDRERVLRIRYYATKHIIYRPFVLYVIASGRYEPSELLLEKCKTCIESCRLYLHNTGDILKRPSQYTWTFSLSSLGAVVVLTLASLCPALKHLVLDIAELHTLVIKNIQPWAAPGSSLEAVVDIVRDIQRKHRILSCA